MSNSAPDPERSEVEEVEVSYGKKLIEGRESSEFEECD
jgi:hypothetical protein